MIYNFLNFFFKRHFNHELVEPDRTRSKNMEIFTEMGICSLQIRKMKPDLQGFYSCKVRDNDNYIVAETGCYINIAEDVAIPLCEDKAKLDKAFTVLPIFVSELNTLVAVVEGDPLKLVCRLNEDCEPKPSVLWFKDGQDITKSKYYTSSYNSQNGECSLIIESCSKILNEGVYACVAALPDSEADFVIKTFSKLRVTASDIEKSSGDEFSSEGEKSGSPLDLHSRGIAPMFLQSLDDTQIEEDEDLELKCQIMGAPIPDITCYFTKDIGDKSATRKLKPEVVSYNLETGICRITIKAATQELNEGFYMVKASNDAGQLTSACQVRMTPKSLPLLNLEKDCQPTFITQLESEIRVMDGQEVVLSCVCSAKPEPNIEWLRQHELNYLPVSYTSDIKATFDASTGRCLLKISDTYPQDAGVYVCIASNLHGRAETRSNLIVEGKSYWNKSLKIFKV